MPKPHAIPITLSQADCATLEGWTRRRKTAQALALRARIVLACAKPGATNSRVAEDLGVSRPTVATWRRRFAERGPDGLLDEPRPGAPRKITDEQIERAIMTTLEATPPNATHWSTRSLAAATGLSQSAVVRIWRAFALQPHRTATFKLSRDPLFVDKVRDVVGLYMSPPDRALVLCVDEKPQIQAVERTAPVLPMRSGQVERRTRLRPARHHRPVRRTQREDWQSDWRLPAAAPHPGVPRLSGSDRGQRAVRSRHPPRVGQCLHS